MSKSTTFIPKFIKVLLLIIQTQVLLNCPDLSRDFEFPRAKHEIHSFGNMLEPRYIISAKSLDQ
jgi:hypothetical protein